MHVCRVTGQEECYEEVQGHVHWAEHHEGQNWERHGRAERESESGSSGSEPDVTINTLLYL